MDNVRMQSTNRAQSNELRKVDAHIAQIAQVQKVLFLSRAEVSSGRETS
jgi:hypothetical protein